MDRHLRLLVIVTLAIAGILSGCIERKPENVSKRESPVTAELTSMLREHEQMRAVGTFSRAVIREADLRHRQTVYQLLTQALIVEPADLFRAAVLLQSEDSTICPENEMLAYYCSIEAARRGYSDARYLAAQSLDKYLVSSGLRQKYGTQLTRDPRGNLLLYPYDTLTSDSERAVWNVPPLDSLVARAERLNARKKEASAATDAEK